MPHTLRVGRTRVAAIVVSRKEKQMYANVLHLALTPDHVPQGQMGAEMALLKLADALGDTATCDNAVDAVVDRIQSLLGSQYKLVCESLRARLNDLRNRLAQ